MSKRDIINVISAPLLYSTNRVVRATSAEWRNIPMRHFWVNSQERSWINSHSLPLWRWMGLRMPTPDLRLLLLRLVPVVRDPDPVHARARARG